MKNLHKIFTQFVSIWIFVLLTTSCLFGQEREVGGPEFALIQTEAMDYLKEKTYRLTLTTEYFEDRNLPITNKLVNINEFEVPGKWRTIEERYSNGKIIREERLWEGKNLYTRTNDGKWEKYSGGGSGGGSF